MIEVSNLYKSFGSTLAVNDLSFTIKPGEIVGLLGPNGAGKTTTMRMLTGFISPDKGSILIDKISVLDNPLQIQQKIGYLPENNPLYKDMLVSELLSYSADLKELDNLTKKDGIDFAVTHVGLSDVYNRPINELSKGYKQRVGIALALLHKPEILIMDEPSEGLDPNQRTDIRNLIKQLSKNHTIIVSTHVMQEVEAVCSRMIIINKGALVADGTPDKLTKGTVAGNEITVEIEGKEVEEKIRKLTGVEKIISRKTKNNLFKGTIIVKKNFQIQPDISKLSSKNNWIIWKLSEQERQLEEVFQELTAP